MRNEGSHPVKPTCVHHWMPNSDNKLACKYCGELAATEWGTPEYKKVSWQLSRWEWVLGLGSLGITLILFANWAL